MEEGTEERGGSELTQEVASGECRVEPLRSVLINLERETSGISNSRRMHKKQKKTSTMEQNISNMRITVFFYFVIYHFQHFIAYFTVNMH